MFKTTRKTSRAYKNKMNKKISLYVCMFMCVLFIVTANGNSRISNKVLYIDKCYNDIWIKVYPEKNTSYQFLNCTLINQTTNVWQCPCMLELYLQIPNGTENTFSFSAQYYTDKLREENNSEAKIYNEQIKRVIQINNFIISEKTEEEVKIEQTTIQKQNEDLSWFVIKFVASFFLLLFLIIAIIIILSKLRKKYNLQEDEKLTIKMIFQKMFSRPDIKRKSVGELLTKSNKPVQQGINKKIEPNLKNVEDEARRILEQISK